MTRRKSLSAGAPPAGGFRRRTFDEAFSMWCEAEAIRDELARPLARGERAERRTRLRGLENMLVPAARQSSAAFERMVLSEAKAWTERHGGMPNISAFIRHFQSLSCATRLRWKSGKLARSGDAAVRKILRKGGFRGERGRPRAPR